MAEMGRDVVARVRHLPDKWHQPMPNSLLILGVTRQTRREESLFIKKPQHQKWNYEHGCKQAQYEPSASGVPNRYREALAYMG